MIKIQIVKKSFNRDVRRFLAKQEDKGVKFLNNIVMAAKEDLQQPRAEGWHNETPTGNDVYSSFPKGPGFTPVDTGRLMAGWAVRTISTTAQRARLFNRTRYARYLEYGTTRFFPRPMVSKWMKEKFDVRARQVFRRIR